MNKLNDLRFKQKAAISAAQTFAVSTQKAFDAANAAGFDSEFYSVNIAEAHAFADATLKAFAKADKLRIQIDLLEGQLDMLDIEGV